MIFSPIFLWLCRSFAVSEMLIGDLLVHDVTVWNFGNVSVC